MEVHCYDCGRCRVMNPASLPISPDEFVAGLGGRFRCTRCGSRQTEARGHIDYSKMFPGYPERGRGAEAMKYIVTLDVEVEDGNSEEDVRRAIEGVAEQAQSGWFGLTGDPHVMVRTVKMAERP